MIWRRLMYLFHRRRLEAEMAEEMAAHRGAMDNPASFGNTLRLREEAADAWGWTWLDELWQDTRHGLRVFSRTKSFAFTAILVLALGTGLNLAFFQVLNLALLVPPNVRSPETLIRLYQHDGRNSSSSVAYPLARYVERESSVLAAVLIERRVRTSWGDDPSVQIDASFVSANYFDELGAGAAYGRVLHPGEDGRADATPAVVLSHPFWRDRMGGEMSVVGRTMRLNGRSVIIAGVAAAGFHGPNQANTHVWAALDQIQSVYPGSTLTSDWGERKVDVYARLKPGIAPMAAREALRVPVTAAGKLHPKELGEQPYLEVSSGARQFRRDRDDRELRTVALVVIGLSSLILLVACANLASLMISHIAARAGEFKMRAALGAGTARVLRQLVTESALLVITGLAGGWLISYGVTRVLLAATDAPFEVPFWPDWRMALTACGIGWIVLLFVGLVPAWRVMASRRLVVTRVPQARLQRILVAAQVIGSCVLLLIGGITTRKLQSILETKRGFEHERVAVLEVRLSSYGIKPEASAMYWRGLREAASQDSRVESVALSTVAPLGRSINEAGFSDAPGLKATVMTVDPGFLPLMNVRLLAGRNFRDADTPETAVIISRRLAERMYGSLDVLGKAFPKSAEGVRAEIIGVTADAPLIKVTATGGAELYRPLATAEMANALLLAKMKADSLDGLRTAAQSVNSAIDPSVRWMKADLERRLLAPRLTSSVAAGVGLLAIALTSLGIFGLVTYTVSLRTREIGIRMALGARAASVLWLVLRGLTWPIVLGTLAGAALVVFGLAPVLSGEPLYADATDPLALAAGLLVLAISGFAACLAPAVRALKINPLEALREQ